MEAPLLKIVGPKSSYTLQHFSLKSRLIMDVQIVSTEGPR